VPPSRADRTALAAFPELACLLELRDAGWVFATTVDNDNQVACVQGVRTWPRGWADAIGIRYTTDTQGLRVDHSGHIVWKLEGGLSEVVNGLLALPAPNSQGAPTLAIGTAPPLWTP
jgi:hypothetical protein